MRLAFLDHHLANFHADTFHRLLSTTLADRGYEVVAAYESDPLPGTDWCADHQVPRARDVSEAVAAADVVLVLAPDNLDTHLDVARRVLPGGRPTVFDKLFALDPVEARAIVSEAAITGTRVFSGSALRYAAECDDLLAGVDPDEVEDVFARGFGQWDHYGIHTLSMAVRLGGADIVRVRDSGTPDSRCLTLDHGDRRSLVDCRAGVNAATALGWSAGVRVGGEWRVATIADHEAFYTNLLTQYLDFFDGGEPDVSSAELVRLSELLAASGTSLAAGGDWVELAAG